MDKLLDAYQEGLMTLADLRKRSPEIKKRALLGVVWVNFGGQEAFQSLSDGLKCTSYQGENRLRLVDG
jgi:glycine betaine/choline ABC-type transport system substrate-binding protein